MQFTWQALIDRARVYIDDDHSDTDGFLAPESWLALGNVEYANLRKKWIRSGLIAPAATNTSFTGPSTTLAGVLAVIGVAENLGSGYRLVAPAQPEYGQDPYWQSASAPTPQATSWMASGSADDLLVELDPAHTGSYVVRWLPTVAYANNPASTIDLPYGGDERLVLGMARRAKLKEGAASALLERLILEQDAELAFTAASRINGLKVRRPVRFKLDRAERYGNAFPPVPPGAWLYL